MDLSVVAGEAGAEGVPHGEGERFAGYGVMGLPFTSGHVLAMRRFPASSIGPGYTSVWHRAPTGEWVFWQDQPSEQGCGRYFSAAVSTVATTEILLEWPEPDQLRVMVPAVGLDWRSTMVATLRSRAFNALGGLLPDRAWRSGRLLAAMGPLAGRLLGVGPVGMAGEVPNGQSFVANPQQIWYVASAMATLAGEDLGQPGSLPEPASLGDFVIPQRGVFAIGRAFFS